MEVGGSQLNAIELADSVAEAGHEVVLFGPRGGRCAIARERDLEVIESPSNNHWPSPDSVAKLTQLVRRRSVDLVHGYEWGPAVELTVGPYCWGQAPRG